MRLGGFFGAPSEDELAPLCAKLDQYGLSAISAPSACAEMADDDVASYGETARGLGLVVGEWGYWNNMMTPDESEQERRVQGLRNVLRKAEVMGVPCVVTLVGTKDVSDHALAPDPYMFTEACKAEFRELVLRVLDGLHLETARYAIEPWCNTFFYQPEDILSFIDSVGHPRFGVHLDQMNMVSFADFYSTTDLINRTFDLLGEHACSVHLKDIAWDYSHMFLKWDEVYIGDGVMDYDTYLKRLAQLPQDTPCYCEHMSQESDYALNFERLHKRAEIAGVRFQRRNPT